MPHKKHRRGFTLIELLIALLILGFIMAVVIASVTKSREKGDDVQVRKTLTDIQVKMASNEVAAGTTDFQKAFTDGKFDTQLTALANLVHAQTGTYNYLIQQGAYAVIFPLKRGGYFCVDYKQAKEVSAQLNATGTPGCDNLVGGSGGGGTGGTGGSGTTNNPPSANAGFDQTITLPTNSVTLTGSGSDTDGTVTSYLWTKVSGAGGTITNPSSPTTTVTGLTAGYYTFKLSVTDNGGAIGVDMVAITVNNTSGGGGGTPYNGPHNIPGTLQAEDFDQGGEGVAYHDADPANQAGKYRPSEGVDIENASDTSGTYDVGWVAAGEWMKYTVVAQTTGTYTFSARVAASYSGSFQVKMDGTTVGTVTVPATGGYQTWQTITGPSMSLTQGTHVLSINIVSDGYNLNYFTFATTTNQSPTANAGPDQTITLPTNAVTLSGSGADSDGTISSYAWSLVSGSGGTITSPSSASTTVTGLSQGVYSFKLTVTDNNGATGTDTVQVTVNQQPQAGSPIPGTIQAEDYNTGGEGVAYHDTSAGNAGGKYRTDDVDIETTADTSGTYNVGWTANGEWLKYNVNVANTGNYTVQVRGASPSGDSYLRMKIDGQFMTAIVIPSTGGWQNWQTATVTGIPLTAGSHTLEMDLVVTSGGGANLNYYTFVYEGASGTPNPAARTLSLHGQMIAKNGGAMYFYDSLPRGYYDSPTKTYPLLVFLHGAGENPPQPPTSLLTGAGVINQINNGAQLEYTINGQTMTFVVIAPQSGVWTGNNIDEIIEYAKQNYKIDTTRIYLTGLSIGSAGTATYFAYSTAYGSAYAQKLAAAALFDGIAGSLATTDYSKDNSTQVPLNYCYASSATLPLWIFNASGHYPDWTNSLISTLNACTPSANPKVTINNDSDSYWKGYIPDHTYYNPNVYEWLLQQHR